MEPCPPRTPPAGPGPMTDPDVVARLAATDAHRSQIALTGLEHSQTGTPSDGAVPPPSPNEGRRDCNWNGPGGGHPAHQRSDATSNPPTPSETEASTSSTHR
jgi:hypothetical protein